MITEECVSKEAMGLIKKLREALDRKAVYTILDDTVANYSDFNALDDTVFMGFGLYIQVTIGFYVDMMNADTGFSIRKHADEIIFPPDTDRAVVIRIVQNT